MAKKAISGYDVHSELYPLSAFFLFSFSLLGLDWTPLEFDLHLPGYFSRFILDFFHMIFFFLEFSFFIGIGLFHHFVLLFPLSDHLSVTPLSFSQIETCVFVTGLGCVHLETGKLGNQDM